ncbi:unnamed protein product [Rangifer tarandus platyrhynchus]|uniref:Uncharacterized protein n=2 Tax=Rangifer tarandus platyrhynchus TaxID=3082113 RepID=A0ACB1MJL9_RANTA|nr:unnamed protein product [Rangifer tarandus platyrhynchus]
MFGTTSHFKSPLFFKAMVFTFRFAALHQTFLKEVKVKVAQSCPTLCHPMDYTVHGMLQARILEWVAFPFPRGSSQPGIKPRSPALQADSLPTELSGKPMTILSLI